MKYFYNVRIKTVRVYNGVIVVGSEVVLQENSYAMAMDYAIKQGKLSGIQHYVTFADGSPVVPV
jgi:hypothetical protein